MDHGQSIIIEIHFTTIVWEIDHLFSHNLILNPWVNTHKKRNKSTAAIITFQKKLDLGNEETIWIILGVLLENYQPPFFIWFSSTTTPLFIA